MAVRSAQISLSLLVGIIVCLRPSLSAVLYDYGESAGDIKVTKGRDVAQQVEFSVNFLRMPFETLYISTKGAILFDTPAEPQSRMIAPFYADIDNSKKGRIWYRTSSKEDDLSRAGEETSRYFPSRKFKPTNILVVTWENVCIQRNRGLSKGITFQAVIITDHHYTFVEFIYSDGNDFPRARSIPVSPVIGFSSSNVEFFDYAVAEETAVVFEKTKSSNVNEEGLWAFQIDGIDPYDIIWGIPEGGNIQGDEAINDGDTDLNINVGLVGDDCNSCAATGSSCVDYGAGSCCVCNVNYMGNGISCLRNETNKPYRANGVISGTVNGDALPRMNVHAFIIASEGRTYTAVSPTPEGLNYTLQLILPIAETIAWLFAVPKNKGINGMTATGGSFSASSRLRFNTGEDLTVEEEYMITGESIRATINLDGTLPQLEEKSLRVDESTAVFTRHRPGIIHSYETRRVFTDSSDIVFTLEKTIRYSDCLADEVDFDLILNSMSLQYSSVNVFHEEEHPNLRFSLRSSISPTSELVRDPCDSNNCHTNAVCLPDADSYRCQCFEGFVGDGFSCAEEIIDPCQENACDENAECSPLDRTYTCTCYPGYTGDGFICKEEVVDPCESNQCSVNADCTPSGDRYYCTCREGYEGDGVTCTREVVDPCESNRCSVDAVCTPSGDRYYCTCREGYEGDGVTCTREVFDPCESNQCSVNADCTPSGGRYYCTCRDGYEGDGVTCRTASRGPCDANRCHPNAICTPEGRTYYCQCEPGFEGDGFDCEAAQVNQCEGNRCDANAVCFPDRNSYICECVSGFEGNGFICEEIFMDPCLENDCNPFARCIPNESVYDCECLAGYEGDGYTCVSYPCSSNECDVNADCFASRDGRNYECRCKDGYAGDGYECEDNAVDVCEGNECDRNGECVPLVNSYDCQCLDGFLGNGFFCIAEDPCYENSCDGNADCSPLGDGYRCTCGDGYQGDGYSCQDIDECSLSISPCDRNADCTNTYGSYRCSCLEGFEGDGTSCQDVDECSLSYLYCDPNAYCDNTFGYYACTCREGFVGDGTSCQASVRPSGDGMLLYGQGKAVMKMPLDPNEEGARVIHKKRQTIVGLAYDCEDDVIYFTDVAKGSISRVKPDGTGYKRLIVKGLSSPEGVAVDHISRNLYWTDSGFDRIEVANLDGQNRRALVTTDLTNPRSIVLDPVNGYLYWTDWNRDGPKIERSFMDGNGREVLVSDGLQLPNGLTIDYISQKICWADAGSEKVECIGVDGDPLTHTTVFAQADYPFGLAAFDQNLYWTDWTMNSVFSVNKNGALSADEMALPHGGTGRLYGIIAAQECSPGSNACASNNGGCSALCLPAPRGARTCACPTDARGNEIPC
ncbi:uncharacterized protein [Apostichopus japonicus]|uniref:uncharacterized protein isoform X4 n=1 Tax=Stichopus japonicus TaxID=307972 RepID=UPI003AB3D8AA